MALPRNSDPSLTDRLTDGAFRALLALMRLFPYHRRIPVAGWAVSRLVAPLAGYRRRVRDNLALACPDMPSARIRHLLRAVPDNVGRTMVELYCGQEFTDRVKDLPEAMQLRALENEAILVSLENLMTFPFVKDAVERDEMSIHGLWNDIGEGTLENYDSATGRFVPI